MRISLLAGTLALMMVGAQAGREVAAQQSIPDAPTAQPTLKLPDLPVAPGQGTNSISNSDTTETPAAPAAAPAASTPDSAQGPEPAWAQGAVVSQPGQGEDDIKTLLVHVDAVDMAFTVKDSKGRLVAGLMPRDVQVYENGVLQHIAAFTNESLPLSVAVVIDQTMTQDEMDRVNLALGALQDAFTQYDEVAVFTYNNGTREVTDFTGAQSARLKQAIDRSKGAGREAPMAGSSGPVGQGTVINNQNVDPNTAAIKGQSSITFYTPREIHPLNDAILTAATALSTRPIERRRVIYVISDGKDFGSKAKTAEVIKYLNINRIEVDGTLVGDSAIWGIGTLDRMHLPLMMRDNNLPPFADATGGNLDSDFRAPEIEKSFAKIALEARSRYTVGWTTREPFLDGKYRHVEIKVLKPDLLVMAPAGYWPRAMEVRQRASVPIQ